MKTKKGAVSIAGIALLAYEAWLPFEWTRWTVIIRKEFVEMIRELAERERKTIKSVIDEAIHAYLDELMLI